MDHCNRLAFCCMCFLMVQGFWLNLSQGEPKSSDECSAHCQALPCYLKAARCFFDTGKPEAVKNLLRPAISQFSQSKELLLYLAKAYLDLGNNAWARRILYQTADVHPKSCQVRSWLIWFHLKMAELEQARSLLQEQGCPDGEEMQTRWYLLSGMLSRYTQKPDQAERAFKNAKTTHAIYPEDRILFEQLRSYSEPEYQKPLRLRLDVSGGYTSDGLAGLPSDDPHPKAFPTALLGLDLVTLFEPPWGKRVRPVFELGLKTLIFTRDTVRDFSHFNFNFRPGLAFWAFRLFYSGQLFWLLGHDKYSASGPRLYYESHRAEIEWNPTRSLTALAGFGRSFFREEPRTRTEFDASLGHTVKIRRLQLLGAISFRAHWAEHQAYDLYGGTLLASATLPFDYIALRARFLFSIDGYPNSANYFNAPGKDQDKARRDLLLKGNLEGWSPAWHGIRMGLTYEISNRNSTIESYDYVDHRVQLRLRLQFDMDPWMPDVATSSTAGHVPLPYGFSRSKTLEEERIQDLLRQEDSARRGSTCVN